MPPVKSFHLPAAEIPVRYETQVLVVGGGSAGVAAAGAAARHRADVTLVERTNSLGGLATGGLIILLLVMDDGRGSQVIAGLCEEVTRRMAARGATVFPKKEDWGDPDDALVAKWRTWGLINGSAPHAVRYAAAYDAEEMKFAFETMCADADVRLLYSVHGCEPIAEDGVIKGVTFQGKTGRFAISADVVIDTTGDGDIFWAGGCAHESEKVAPWLWFTMGGVTGDLDAKGAGSRFFHTLGDGHVLFPWGATSRVSRLIDATDPEDITFAATECRKLVMAEVDRLKREVPGFENAHLCHIADQLDVTESRRLVGEYVLTRDDMDKPFDDVVAVTGHWTKYGALYEIPYRSLLAQQDSNLLTAGRGISVDHRTHHATKEIPACMATGEAAGTAAAMAVSDHTPLRSISVPALQQRLEAQGAIVHAKRGPRGPSGM